MRVQVFDESPVLKRLDVEVEAETVDRELARAYRELAGRVKMPGFRPGKIPVHLLKQQFGARVENDVTERLLRHSFEQAVKEKSLNFVGNPRFEDVELRPGQAFVYKAKVEVKPEIQIKTLKLGEIKKERVQLAEGAVDKEIDALRKRFAQLKSRAEDAISENGDILTLDFLGKIDGIAFDGGAGKDVPLELGSDSFIPGFESQLTGVARGSHTIQVTFPADYARKELADKAASFDVVIKDIKQRELPELNEDFFKRVGIENLEALQGRIEKELRDRVRDESERKFKEALFKSVIEKNPFEIPPSLVNRQIDRHVAETRRRLGQQGIDVDNFGIDFEGLREELRERSTFEVSAGLVIEEIARSEGLTIGDADLTAHFEKLAEASGEPVAKVAAFFRAKDRLDLLKFQLLEEKVLDLLTSKATITEVDPETSPNT